MAIVLDSGALTAFARPNRSTRARLAELRAVWDEPLVVPAAVLMEATTGSGARDANVNRLLRGCRVVPLDESLARRAATLRFRSRHGSAVDASVVATAEQLGGGVVVTGDRKDLDAIASNAVGVDVVSIL